MKFSFFFFNFCEDDRIYCTSKGTRIFRLNKNVVLAMHQKIYIIHVPKEFSTHIRTERGKLISKSRQASKCFPITDQKKNCSWEA